MTWTEIPTTTAVQELNEVEVTGLTEQTTYEVEFSRNADFSEAIRSEVTTTETPPSLVLKEVKLNGVAVQNWNFAFEARHAAPKVIWTTTPQYTAKLEATAVETGAVVTIDDAEQSLTRNGFLTWTITVSHPDTPEGDPPSVYSLSVEVEVRFFKDITGLNAYNNSRLKGVWSDGVTVWACDEAQESAGSRVYAYDIAKGERDSAKDFIVTGINADFLWSDGTTMWFAPRDIVLRAGQTPTKALAYKLSDRTRDSAKDITLTSWQNILRPARVTGMTGDEDGLIFLLTSPTIAVDNAFRRFKFDKSGSEEFGPFTKSSLRGVAKIGDKLYFGDGNRIRVWDESEGDDGAEDTSAEFSIDSPVNTRIDGMTVFTENLFVSDGARDGIFTYKIDGTRPITVITPGDPGSRNLLFGAPGNSQPGHIWSDGTRLWVLDSPAKRVFCYSLSDFSRVSSREMALSLPSGTKYGSADNIWGDGSSLYVTLRGTRLGKDEYVVQVYSLGDGSRQQSKDFANQVAGSQYLGQATNGEKFYWLGPTVNQGRTIARYFLDARRSDILLPTTVIAPESSITEFEYNFTETTTYTFPSGQTYTTPEIAYVGFDSPQNPSSGVRPVEKISGGTIFSLALTEADSRQQLAERYNEYLKAQIPGLNITISLAGEHIRSLTISGVFGGTITPSYTRQSSFTRSTTTGRSRVLRITARSVSAPVTTVGLVGNLLYYVTGSVFSTVDVTRSSVRADSRPTTGASPASAIDSWFNGTNTALFLTPGPRLLRLTIGGVRS